VTAGAHHVVVGTAGHIDHGKSTLVRALTGTDPDRLPEEKRRGITIDLGFAHTTIAGVAFSFVDVPGHEKFVHNMLAGATGIDLLLLVVAADESVMPQTREHLGICRLLGLQDGVVALTRTDLCDDELVELARDDVADLVRGTFLEDRPIVRVSGVTGAGLDFRRGGLDRFGDGVGQFAQAAVRLGRGPFLQAGRMDHAGVHAAIADREQRAGAFGLRAPVAVRRDGDGAEAVGFRPRRGHGADMGRQGACP
jgi:small GTP-binding protein